MFEMDNAIRIGTHVEKGRSYSRDRYHTTEIQRNSMSHLPYASNIRSPMYV